jgi:type II secretory pathway pseudopilin PulG
MVVLVILTIIAAIAVPSFTGYVRRLRVEEQTKRAELVLDTMMEMAGQQYAQSRTGNPWVGSASGSPILSWASNYSLDESALGDQYVYLDSYVYNIGGTAYVRMSLANLAAPDAERSSEGIRQFTNRTLLGVPHVPWKTTGQACEKQLTYSVYFRQTGSNVPNASSISFGQIPEGKYFRYNDIAAAVFYFPDVDTTNASSTGGYLVTYGYAAGVADNASFDSGNKVWQVYERVGTGWRLLGSRAG